MSRNTRSGWHVRMALTVSAPSPHSAATSKSGNGFRNFRMLRRASGSSSAMSTLYFIRFSSRFNVRFGSNYGDGYLHRDARLSIAYSESMIVAVELFQPCYGVAEADSPGWSARAILHFSRAVPHFQHQMTLLTSSGNGD